MTRVILTCSPHFVPLAHNELRRVHPEISLLQTLSSGCSLLEFPHSFDKLTLPWRQRTPLYLHHLFPVRVTLPLEAALNDLSRLKQAAQRFLAPDVTLQVRSVVERDLPYSAADIHRCLDESQPAYTQALPTGRILSILLAETSEGLHAYLGVSWATQNLSPWSGGQIPICEPVSNRAGYKLIEALVTFSIRLHQGDHALDLGATPGAWTTLLRRRGLNVTAVAPTPLYPWLMFDTGVIYQPIIAETFLTRCTTTFDLIVNDMWLDPRDSARLMVDYSQHLRSEGIAIMTLKLRGRTQERNMDHAFRLLRKAYKIIRVRQLVANRKEVTLFLRRKT